MNNTIALQRLEFGKFCERDGGTAVVQDGQIVGLTVLGSSPKFFVGKEKLFWKGSQAKSYINDELDAYLYGPLVVESENDDFVITNTILREKEALESHTTGRLYPLMRYFSHVIDESSPLASPLTLYQAAAEESLIGLSKQSANNIKEVLVYAELDVPDWNEENLYQALQYVMTGTPIVLRVDKNKMISAGFFFQIANSIWKHLPDALRPMFSAAYNIEGMEGKLCLVAGTEVPEHAAELSSQGWLPPKVPHHSFERIKENWTHYLNLFSEVHSIDSLQKFYERFSLSNGVRFLSKVPQKPGIIVQESVAAYFRTLSSESLYLRRFVDTILFLRGKEDEKPQSYLIKIKQPTDYQKNQMLFFLKSYFSICHDELFVVKKADKTRIFDVLWDLTKEYTQTIDEDDNLNFNTPLSDTINVFIHLHKFLVEPGFVQGLFVVSDSFFTAHKQHLLPVRRPDFLEHLQMVLDHWKNRVEKIPMRRVRKKDIHVPYN